LTVLGVFWDLSFGGWMVSLTGFGIHESNFVKEDETGWIPVKGALWSYWVKK
jgi:hypothetical protein